MSNSQHGTTTAHPMADLPANLTTRDLAELVRAPESTVRYWRHIGTGPAGFRVGRRVLYRREVVEAWLAGLEVSQHDAAAS